LAFVAPTAGCANITVMLAPFLIVHCLRVAIPSSLALELPLHCPLPSRSHRAIHCLCPVPSIAFKFPSRRPSPFIAVESIAVALPLRRPLPCPSPLSCHHCAVHCCPCRQAVYRRRIAVAPSTIHCQPASIAIALSIAVKPSIAVKLSIAVAPSITVSHPAGCCVASRHTDASH
jgi:hypothetical protein